MSVGGKVFMKVLHDFISSLGWAVANEKLFQLRWDQKQKELKKDFPPNNEVYSRGREINCGGRTKFWGEAHVRRRIFYFLEGSKNSLIPSLTQLSIAVPLWLKEPLNPSVLGK